MATGSDRDLLFGVLAVQTEAITQQQLVHAMQACVADKTRSLGGMLRDQGALDDAHYAALEALVNARIQLHDDNVSQTLAHCHTAESIRVLFEDSREADVLNVHRSNWSEMLPQTHGTPLNPTPTNAPSLLDVMPRPTDQRFRIIRFHDQGGLGNVYVAEDTELGREVALKELKKETADDPESRNRFVAEAEITGGLEHPGIVPVYALGRYDDGRPFYAMRFIRGENLESKIRAYHTSDWRNQGGESAKNMELRRLLNCFVDVCQAVHYAHQRGVLHRDIKPGNIMIGRYGETLVVDWGLAKPLGQRPIAGQVGMSCEETLLPTSNSTPSATRLGSAMGTPKFMSPEQARGEHQQLGVTTDIFSLGATLYYLLTNHGPYDEQPDVLAAARQGRITRPRHRTAEVAPALESICLMAMAPQPTERYESAQALADDVEQFLGDEPVIAHRESLRERAVRLARRHRAWTQAAVAALLVIALVSMTAAFLINRQENIAQIARTDAVASADRTQRVLDYLVNAFRRADPSVDGRTVTVVSVLAQAVAKADELLADDALEKAQLLQALGQTFLGLGQLDEAEQIFEEAYRIRENELGAANPLTIASKSAIGSVHYAKSEIDDAIRVHEQVLDARRSSLGSADDETISSMTNLAMSYFAADRIQESLDLCEEVVRLKKEHLGDEDPSTLISMTNLANCYEEVGRTEEALNILQRVYHAQVPKLGADHADTLVTMNNLALAKLRVGEFDEAVDLLEEALQLRREKYGWDHLETIQTMNHLARAYFSAGRLDQAFPMYQQALERSRVILGADHRETLMSMNNLANAYHQTNQWTQAIPLYESTLESRRRQLGDDHAESLMTMRSLAMAYRDVGQFAASANLWQELVDHNTEKYGEFDGRTLQSVIQLQKVYLQLGRFAESQALYGRCLKALEDPTLPAAGKDKLVAIGVFEAEAKLAQGDVAGAIKRAEKVIETLAAAHQDTFEYQYALHVLGRALAEQGEDARAKALLVESFENMEASLDDWNAAHHWFILQAGRRLVDYFERHESVEDTAVWQQRVQDIEQKIAKLRGRPLRP